MRYRLLRQRTDFELIAGDRLSSVISIADTLSYRNPFSFLWSARLIYPFPSPRLTSSTLASFHTLVKFSIDMNVRDSIRSMYSVPCR